MINNFIKNTFVKNFLISKLISIRSLGSWILSTLLLYAIYLFCKVTSHIFWRESQITWRRLYPSQRNMCNEILE